MNAPVYLRITKGTFGINVEHVNYESGEPTERDKDEILNERMTAIKIAEDGNVFRYDIHVDGGALEWEDWKILSGPAVGKPNGKNVK